jgi:hypothetical protein
MALFMLANIDFTDKWRTKPAQPHQHIPHVIPPQILSILSNEERSIYPGEEGGFCSIFLEFIDIG